MDSKEQNTLFITGKEKVVFIEDVIKNELRRHPNKRELAVLRVATAIYQFHDQWIVLPSQLVGTPGELRELKKIITNVFGDREGVTFHEQWNDRDRCYEVRVVTTEKENRSLAEKQIRYHGLFNDSP